MAKARTFSRYSIEAASLLGKQIKLGRKQRKWTEHDLADRAEISQATLQKIEKGDLTCAIGGVRPKALIESDNRKYIAKFSATADLYNVVKIEFIAMRLAKLIELDVAPVSLAKSSHKDVAHRAF